MNAASRKREATTATTTAATSSTTTKTGGGGGSGSGSSRSPVSTKFSSSVLTVIDDAGVVSDDDDAVPDLVPDDDDYGGEPPPLVEDDSDNDDKFPYEDNDDDDDDGGDDDDDSSSSGGGGDSDVGSGQGARRGAKSPKSKSSRSDDGSGGSDSDERDTNSTSGSEKRRGVHCSIPFKNRRPLQFDHSPPPPGEKRPSSPKQFVLDLNDEKLVRELAGDFRRCLSVVRANQVPEEFVRVIETAIDTSKQSKHKTSTQGTTSASHHSDTLSRKTSRKPQAPTTSTSMPQRGNYQQSGPKKPDKSHTEKNNTKAKPAVEEEPIPPPPPPSQPSYKVATCMFQSCKRDKCIMSGDTYTQIVCNASPPCITSYHKSCGRTALGTFSTTTAVDCITPDCPGKLVEARTLTNSEIVSVHHFKVPEEPKKIPCDDLKKGSKKTAVSKVQTKFKPDSTHTAHPPPSAPAKDLGTKAPSVAVEVQNKEGQRLAQKPPPNANNQETHPKPTPTSAPPPKKLPLKTEVVCVVPQSLKEAPIAHIPQNKATPLTQIKPQKNQAASTTQTSPPQPKIKVQITKVTEETSAGRGSEVPPTSTVAHTPSTSASVTQTKPASQNPGLSSVLRPTSPPLKSWAKEVVKPPPVRPTPPTTPPLSLAPSFHPVTSITIRVNTQNSAHPQGSSQTSSAQEQKQKKKKEVAAPPAPQKQPQLQPNHQQHRQQQESAPQQPNKTLVANHTNPDQCAPKIKITVSPQPQGTSKPENPPLPVPQAPPNTFTVSTPKPPLSQTVTGHFATQQIQKPVQTTPIWQPQVQQAQQQINQPRFTVLTPLQSGPAPAPPVPQQKSTAPPIPINNVPQVQEAQDASSTQYFGLSSLPSSQQQMQQLLQLQQQVREVMLAHEQQHQQMQREHQQKMQMLMQQINSIANSTQDHTTTAPSLVTPSANASLLPFTANGVYLGGNEYSDLMLPLDCDTGPLDEKVTAHDAFLKQSLALSPTSYDVFGNNSLTNPIQQASHIKPPLQTMHNSLPTPPNLTFTQPAFYHPSSTFFPTSFDRGIPGPNTNPAANTGPISNATTPTATSSTTIPAPTPTNHFTALSINMNPKPPQNLIQNQNQNHNHHPQLQATLQQQQQQQHPPQPQPQQPQPQPQPPPAPPHSPSTLEESYFLPSCITSALGAPPPHSPLYGSGNEEDDSSASNTGSYTLFPGSLPPLNQFGNSLLL
ncbi:hypothetical protein Pelo_9224 [Pelomyxa schiedti]|nr:hypothetical protein Pelo_9224 [Pelomyxa schiedti]